MTNDQTILQDLKSSSNRFYYPNQNFSSLIRLISDLQKVLNKSKKYTLVLIEK